MTTLNALYAPIGATRYKPRYIKACKCSWHVRLPKKMLFLCIRRRRKCALLSIYTQLIRQVKTAAPICTGSRTIHKLWHRFKINVYESPYMLLVGLLCKGLSKLLECVLVVSERRKNNIMPIICPLYSDATPLYTVRDDNARKHL